MGVVYLAEDTRLRRKVAIKSLSAKWADNADARGRLLSWLSGRSQPPGA